MGWTVAHGVNSASHPRVGNRMPAPSPATQSAPPTVTAKALWTLAWPIMLSRASQAVVGLSDALMVAPLGAKALAATSTGAMNAFAILILPLGVTFLVSSFTSQMFGQGDSVGARRFGWYGLILAAIAQVLCLAMLLVIQPILDWIPLETEVRQLMAGYIAIRLCSGGAAVGIEALANYFGGLGKTRPGMIANVCLMVANIIGNWALIGGHWGCPAMGVRGAALASSISAWIAFAGLFVYFLWQGRVIAFTALRRSEFMRLIQFGLPAGVNWFLEIFAFIFFTNAVVGSLGTTTLAGMNCVMALNSVSFMPAFGLASAGAILVGQAIGAGAKDLVPKAVALTTAATLIWQGATGVAYFLIPELLIAPFAQGEGADETLKIGVRMLIISSTWQLFDAVATSLAEALRAAGDTTFPMVARLVIAWVVFVPGSLISVKYFGWGDAAATSWIVAYLALLAAALLWRFRTGAWRHVQLLETPGN